MPSRPRSHQLREESERAFKNALPLEWVAQRMEDDYGLDYHVEVFEDGRATGDAFYAQLKGTDDDVISSALKTRIKVETADYWSRQALPVLVVRYHAPSGGLYTQWFHAFDPHLAGLAPDWHEQQTFTFTVPESRLWSENTTRQLAAELAAFRRLRTASFGLPLRFFVSADPDVVASALELTSQLTKAAELVSYIVCFSAAPARDGALTVHIARDTIAANLAGVASVTSHRGTASTPVEAVPFDALVVVGAALDRVSRPDLASQVLLSGLGSTTLLDLPDMVWLVTSILSRTDRLGDALDLVELLIGRGDEDSEAAASVLLGFYWAYGPGVRRAHREQFHGILEDLVERRLAEGETIGAAALTYSLGNSSREAQNAKEALRYYLRAARLDPNYRDAPYWNAEIAGLIWGRGHFLIASDFYRKAVELGHTEIQGHLGDALLYAGRYADAQAAFLAYLENAKNPPPEWSLQGPAPEWLLKASILNDVRSHGGDAQVRKPQAAADAVEAALVQGGRRQAVTSLHGALTLDALCPDAWYWLAIFQGVNESRPERSDGDAFVRGMLIAALVLRHSPEAWSNAIVALWQRDRASEDFGHAVRCARFLTGDEVLTTLSSAADNWDSPQEAADMIEAVGAVEQPMESRDFRLRVRMPDGAYSELVVVHGPVE